MKTGKKPDAGYEILEHLSDIGVRFYGRTPEELFSNAAKAMFSIMGRFQRSGMEISRRIAIDKIARSYDDLLILWLERLLYFFEVRGIIFFRFKVENIEKVDGTFGLTARVWGEKYDSDRHRIEVIVKAPTYHRLEVRKESGRWKGRVIFDV